MRLNIDRLCELAGIGEGKDKMLNEASNLSYHDDPALTKEKEVQFSNQLNEAEDDELSEAEEDELKEVEEVRNLQEAHLKATIKREIQNIINEMSEADMEEMKLGGQWIYGNRKPKNSMKGRVAQGATIPGIGFYR